MLVKDGCYMRVPPAFPSVSCDLGRAGALVTSHAAVHSVWFPSRAAPSTCPLIYLYPPTLLTHFMSRYGKV